MIRLLKKEDIVAIKSKERKQEVDEGLKVAKRVDGLRETLANEEAGLTKFRVETVKVIQAEIDKKIAEKNALEGEVEFLKKEKIRELPPTQAVKKWEKKIEADKKKNEEWTAQLLERETNLIGKESSFEIKNKTLFSKEEILREKQKLAETYLAETRKNYDLSESIRYKMESTKERVDKELESKTNALTVREQELFFREESVKNQKIEIEKERKEIDNERIHIQSQQESLRVAWEQIKKLQQ